MLTQNENVDGDGGANKCAVCSIESKLRCSNCGNAFYCSVSHQRENWKIHKKLCYPFQIKVNDEFGRHLIASRDIKPGEIVLKESPLICGPSQITIPVCIGCLQGLNEGLNQECDRCGWPICSKSCQSSMHHKNECDLTVERGSKVSIKQYFSPHPTYQCLTTLRCLMLKDRKIEVWKKLMELESHCDQRRGSVMWLNDREGVAKFIQRFFKCDKWTEEEILKVAGIVQINGHEVPLTEPPHVAIYHLASFLEHSCKANLTKTFTSKGDITLWTVGNIKKGEHLSISYTDTLWGTASRQHHLLQTKLFQCKCIRCADVTELGTYYSAIKCNSKENPCDGLALPVSLEKWEEDWRCNKCERIVEQKYVANIIERAGKDINAMEKGKEEHCIKYIEHYSKWLPIHHFYICDVNIALTQIIGAGGPQVLQSITDEKLILKIQLCQELLKIYKIIAAAETRHLGALHFELHAALAEWGRRGAQQCNNSFKGALEESLTNAENAIRLLEKEPNVLPEGKICEQARINVESLKVLLGSTSSIDL